MQQLTNQMIHEKLKSLCRSERAITAEILTFINEVTRRQLHLEMGYDSLLNYLIKEMGYSKTAALRRMDAAKLLSEIPDLKKDFSEGTLNLTQASLLAQGVRQKLTEHKKEIQSAATSTQVDMFQPEVMLVVPRRPIISTEQKKQIVDQLRNQTLESSQKKVAQALDLQAKADERKRLQRDNSVRAEMTFTEQQMKNLDRVKQLLSHVHPGGKLTDIIAYMTEEFLERRDPVRKAAKKASKGLLRTEADQSKLVDMQSDPQTKVAQSESRSGDQVPLSEMQLHQDRSATDLSGHRPRKISAATKRIVFQNHESCQWCDPFTNQKCGSQFQLQLDHIQPVWAGGSDEAENLQLLCAAHNRFKYLQESHTQRIRSALGSPGV